MLDHMSVFFFLKGKLLNMWSCLQCYHYGGDVIFSQTQAPIRLWVSFMLKVFHGYWINLKSQGPISANRDHIVWYCKEKYHHTSFMRSILKFKNDIDLNFDVKIVKKISGFQLFLEDKMHQKFVGKNNG